MDNIMVTIICLCYNHEKYIRKALEGFVMQKTNFKYEVIVHDDASTDNSANIIRDYAEKYDYIKPIFQTENQYSKGISISQKIVYSISRGKYIAYCEGDDYWIDCYKLQKQVDFLESHSEYVMCCHAYNKINEADNKIISVCETKKCDGELNAYDVIMYEKPTQLATQMFRADILLEKPNCFSGYGVGDYPTLLYVFTKGRIFYFSKIMSNYRTMSMNSWSKKMKYNRSARIEHYNNMIRLLNMYNMYTNAKYKDLIDEKILQIEFSLNILSYDYKKVKKNKMFKCASLKRKIITNIGIYFPRITRKFEEFLVSKRILKS